MALAARLPGANGGRVLFGSDADAAIAAGGDPESPVGPRGYARSEPDEVVLRQEQADRFDIVADGVTQATGERAAGWMSVTTATRTVSVAV